ncbi:MAG: OmpA family protein [Cytophagales bacterium]|nr:OmpA family protein [Cytophagales bacterium]
MKKINQQIGLALLLCLISYSSLLAQDDYLKRERLPDNINTEFTETKPIISYDNRTLFLTRQNHPDNTGGRGDIQDIYYSPRDANQGWTTPINMGSPLNNQHPNGISALSKTADTALVINVFDGDSYDKGASISMKEGESWSTPKAINIKKFRNFSDYVDYFISSTGEHLFLAIESRDTYGDQDIYVSTKIDDFNWTEPVNIGSGVNTEAAEFSPFLSSDNKILFFASYGHDSYGDADIFYSERLDDTWTNWSEAKNLGENVNTEGFEAYYTIPARGDWAYFVSDVESNANSRDIFRALIPLELNPTPGVIVSGITMNELTKAAITAEVNITEIDGKLEPKTFTTDNDKHIYRRSILEFPRTFRLLVEQANYMTTSQYLTVEYSDKREVKADLYLVPIEVGNTLISHDVRFDGSVLTDMGLEELERMVAYLNEYPEIKFSIVTHVANSGDADKDKSLSVDRLQTIELFFQNAGIDPSRLTFASAGSTESFDNVNAYKIFDTEQPDDRVTFTIYADQDGDGVEDPKDKCIDEPGIPENSGCPEIAEDILQVFEQALQGIQFETAKAVIKPESFSILDNVVEIMKNNDAFFLKIEGHTDSQGGDDANQVLSDNRAKSTMKYLTDKGVAAERLKAYGFGETQPVADNETAAGRAKNRRVVFEVVFDAADL